MNSLKTVAVFAMMLMVNVIRKDNKMNNELFEKLISLKTDTHTARMSDDGSAIATDEQRYQNALANQDEFTDEEIHAESVRRWNLMIAKMNEEYKKRNEQ
jgi:hypothetical protein